MMSPDDYHDMTLCPDCEADLTRGEEHAADCALAIGQRLEELRAALRAEDISYGELAELADLAPWIEPGDVELLEPAGVPEELAYMPIAERMTYRDAAGDWSTPDDEPDDIGPVNLYPTSYGPSS